MSDIIIKKRNCGLDILKGIACIMVIMIHCRFPGIYGEIFISLARPAVALFFVISGFYAYDTEFEKTRQKVLRGIKKTTILLIFSLLFYFFWEAFIRFAGSGIVSMKTWISQYVLTINPWKNAILWDYDPLAGHLWFVFALLKVYIFAVLFLKLNKKTLGVITSLLFAMMIVLEILGVSLRYYRNGWIYGIVFFIIGYLLAHLNQKIGLSKIKKHMKCFLFGGTALTLLEYYIWGVWQIYVGSIFIVISLFIIAYTSNIKTSIISRVFFYLGFKYSTIIYIFHWSINEVWGKIGKIFEISNSRVYMWLSPFIVVFLSISSSVLLIKILSFLRNSDKKRLTYR